MASEFIAADDLERRRRFLFRVCRSKEELHDWVLVYLGLDLPDCIVHADSNSSPMDMVWESYSKMLEGTDEEFLRVLYYASRDSFKTLGAAVIEVLALLHCNRSAAHMAAIQEQALKSQEYVKRAFRRAYLRDFVVGDNERITKIVRYYNPTTEHSLTQQEFDSLSVTDQENYQQIQKLLLDYVEREVYVKIIICTLQGANCVDPGMTITMADGTKRLAMDVNVGDLVRVYDTVAREWLTAPISEKGLTVKPAMRVSFEDGGSVVVSDDHQVFTNTGWLQARTLKVGDLCFDASGVRAPTTKHEGVCLSIHEKPCQPENVLLGTLLGDASITWPKNKHGVRYGRGPRLSITHGATQKAYLEYKVKLLKRLGLTFSLCQDGTNWKATSGVSELLIPYFDLLYGTGRKALSKKVLDLVNDEVLAFWIMDDGAGCPQVVGSRKDYRLSVATCCFSQEENEAAVARLRVLGFEASVGTVSNSKASYPVVELTLDSSRLAAQRLAVYFHHTLKYKLPSPPEALVTRCIDCDRQVPLVQRQRFHRCGACKRPDSAWARRRNRDYKKRFTKKIVKLEWLPTADLLDLHVDTSRPGAHNFIGNSSILLHNSEHVPLLIIDEADVVVNTKAYEEAQNIPAGRGGKLPLTIITSTRKQAFGLVQKEIDRQEESGLKVRHWNIVDVTEACPPSRHKPELPRLPLYVAEDDLKHTDEAGYQALNFKERERYVKTENNFAGCKSCKLFSACKGRLATHQKSKSLLLKSIPEVIGKFKANSTEMALAQLLCKKPSSTGLIYGRLSKARHVILPAQAYEKVFGELPPDPKNYTKAMLVRAFRDHSLECYGGVDWGHTHLFAHVQGFKDGSRFFVTAAIGQAGLDPDQMLLVSEPLKENNPRVYPDTADPKMIKLFKKHGWTMAGWNKGPATVDGGITVVRHLLNPFGQADPFLYFVVDIGEDEQMMECVNSLAEYHYKSDPATKTPTNVPDKVDDDFPDAVRYMLMNVFTLSGRIVVPAGSVSEILKDEVPPPSVQGYDPQNWIGQKIAELTGREYEPPAQSRQRPSMTIEAPEGSGFKSYYGSDEEQKSQEDTKKKGKKGRLVWDIS